MTNWYKILIASILTCYFCSTANAFCFESAGKAYGIDPLILYSIAWVESGFNPYAINYNKNSYDYGLMQINTFWYKYLGDEKWKYLSDPCMNVMVGAWILSLCREKHKDIWSAVGCYHSPNKKRGRKYANRVRNVYNKVVKKYGAYWRQQGIDYMGKLSPQTR